MGLDGLLSIETFDDQQTMLLVRLRQVLQWFNCAGSTVILYRLGTDSGLSISTCSGDAHGSNGESDYLSLWNGRFRITRQAYWGDERILESREISVRIGSETLTCKPQFTGKQSK